MSRVIRDMLGIRMAADQLELNPVLPGELDGTKITVTFCGRTKTICYRVHEKGFGVVKRRFRCRERRISTDRAASGLPENSGWSLRMS